MTSQNPKKCCEKCWTNHPSHPEGGYCSDYICPCHSKNVEDQKQHKPRTSRDEQVNVGEKHKECGDPLCWCFRGMADKVAETSKNVGEGELATAVAAQVDRELLEMNPYYQAGAAAKDFNDRFTSVMKELAEEENTPGGDTGWKERLREILYARSHSKLEEVQELVEREIAAAKREEREMHAAFIENESRAAEKRGAGEMKARLEAALALDKHISEAEHSYKSAVADQAAPYRHQLELLLELRSRLKDIT